MECFVILRYYNSGYINNVHVNLCWCPVKGSMQRIGGVEFKVILKAESEPISVMIVLFIDILAHILSMNNSCKQDMYNIDTLKRGKNKMVIGKQNRSPYI